MTRTPIEHDHNRALLNAVPVAIVAADPETGVVTDANDAFLELVQRTRDEVIGAQHPFPWRHGDGDEPTEPGTVVERRYRCTDGRTFPVQIATHLVPGEPPLVVRVVTDLSEKQRLEQQLVQSAKLAAIGELAGGVAHEINNPLLAILALTEFLLLEVDPQSKQHERLVLIQETGLEIKEIVRALLDFARGRPDEMRIIELEEVVRGTVDLIRRTNTRKDVLIVERYDAPGVLVRASGNQLEQVVLNLIGNARHAMGTGGVIEVTVARDGDDVVCVVRDDGPGMSPELQQRIFEPFFTTRRGAGGTGLGLTASLGIASAHGGELTVESALGAGAAFTLRLPVQEAPA